MQGVVTQGGSADAQKPEAKRKTIAALRLIATVHIIPLSLRCEEQNRQNGTGKSSLTISTKVEGIVHDFRYAASGQKHSSENKTERTEQ